jgi:hypothetical protein
VKYRLGQLIQFIRDNGDLCEATIIERCKDTREYKVTYFTNGLQMGKRIKIQNSVLPFLYQKRFIR